MIGKLGQAALLVTVGLALSGFSGCTAPQTANPVKRAPAPDYQAPVAAVAAGGRGSCYESADLTTLRARMLQQQLSVATLQCLTTSGSRFYESKYGAVLSKFSSDLQANGRALNQLAGRKRFNVDVVVTEFANRTAQKAPVEKDFCDRSGRAFDWALDPKAATLNDVPPIYDLGPDMNFVPCAGTK